MPDAVIGVGSCVFPIGQGGPLSESIEPLFAREKA
jgi:hypothetical protein